MKKSNIETRAMLNSVKNINNRQHEIANKRAELKRETAQLRAERREEARKFIESALNNFMLKMKNGWRGDYIRGNYSDDFTKHVNRNLYLCGVNNEHYQAIETYKLALENLNRTFVNALENDPDARDRIINMSGLKNLH